MSCLLIGENESRNSANTGKLALFSRFTLPVTLYHCSRMCLYHLRFLNVISFQYTGPFYDCGQGSGMVSVCKCLWFLEKIKVSQLLVDVQFTLSGLSIL